jgi:hypothetical protein
MMTALSFSAGVAVQPLARRFCRAVPGNVAGLSYGLCLVSGQRQG